MHANEDVADALAVANVTSHTWVFGYGSLIHTPNFHYDKRVNGFILGFRRVFWQGSTDHRGCPARPGRTVTLTLDDHPTRGRTWGAAFRLAGTPQEQAATLSYLEWREKQYDVRHYVDVHNADGKVLVSGALVYIASPTNTNYLGPAELTDIAAQIATSRGPSGPNWEYLFRLADAMRGMGVQDDPDLYELEEMVRQEMAVHGRAGTGTGAVAAAEVASAAADVGAVHGGALVGRVVGGSEAEAREAAARMVAVAEEEQHVDFRRWHQRAQHQGQQPSIRPGQQGQAQDFGAGQHGLAPEEQGFAPGQGPQGQAALGGCTGAGGGQVEALQYAVEAVCGTAAETPSLEPG